MEATLTFTLMGDVSTIHKLMVHPLASVTVTVLLPLEAMVRSSVTWPPDHKYVYGAVPPATVISTDPGAVQVGFTCVSVMVSGASGAVTTAVADSVHPFASPTVTVYVPPARFTAVCVVCPLFH